MVGLDADGEGWAVGVGADRVHKRDKHAVLGDDCSHAGRPGRAEIGLDGTEESAFFFVVVGEKKKVRSDKTYFFLWYLLCGASRGFLSFSLRVVVN